MNLLPVVVALAVLSPATAVSIPWAAPPAPSAPDWNIELVHAFGGSSAPPIRVDSAGHPHVLACPPGEVWYSARNTTGWRQELVANTTAGGVCGKLALDAAGDPHITLPPRPGDPGQMYAKRVNGVWSFLPVPFPAADLEVGPAEVPAIVGVGSSLRYATLQGSWQVETVDAFGGSAGFTWADMEFNARDEPRVLYYDSIRGDVRYAFRNDRGWHLEIVEHIGSIGAAGKQGALALNLSGNPQTIYFVLTGPGTSDLRYATRDGSDAWDVRVLDTQGSSPAIAVSSEGIPQVVYIRLDYYDPSRAYSETRLLHATRIGDAWEFDTVLNAVFDGSTAAGTAAQFPSMVFDSCVNPHVSYYYTRRVGSDLTGSGAYYATKGEPCDGTVPTTLRMEPRTLNLRSRGRWVTAGVAFGEAVAADVDPASLRLEGIRPDRVQVVNDTALVAKVSRNEFAAAIAGPGMIEVCVTGALSDGRAFRACDTIRVIRSGR